PPSIFVGGEGVTDDIRALTRVRVPETKFAAGEAELYLLGAREGGRHTPFGTGYMPQFFFGATDVTGERRGEGARVHAGEHAHVRFTLQKQVGIGGGMLFALREGSRTIGAGLIPAVG